MEQLPSGVITQQEHLPGCAAGGPGIESGLLESGAGGRTRIFQRVAQVLGSHEHSSVWEDD